MASALWGNVYYGRTLAGVLRELSAGRVEFKYDSEYAEDRGKPVSYLMPVRPEPFVSEDGLHPFFDNLVAEGWLRSAQARSLGIHESNRLALLLAFGNDCAGAVSVVDPERAEVRVEFDAPEITAALLSRASLSGVQPKLFAVKEGGGFRPTRSGEESAFIAKLPSQAHNDLIELEWLTTKAAKALLPREPIADLQIAPLNGICETALLIRRFDRQDGRRLHFEEFNSLVGNKSEDKYRGSYEQLGAFILSSSDCVPAEAERLFRRILACFLLGNTDAHLKNFAMMHSDAGLRLTPAYDLVASAYYRQYNTLALSILGARSLRLAVLAPKHVVGLATAYGLSAEVILLAVEDLNKRRGALVQVIESDPFAGRAMREGLLSLVEKRWNATFASIGTTLSKRREREDKLRGFRKRDSPRSPE